LVCTAAPPQLLPQPQRAVWGKGNLPLAGVTVVVTGRASEEDRFAAAGLASALSSASGRPVAVGDGSAEGRQIQLIREGADMDAPLPAPGDHAGPDSREAYRLKVTPQGGEIRARSSAGLFYAIQTIRQLAAVSSDSGSLPEVEIEDWPSLAYRGLMVDTSHGPLPTEDEVKREIDFLARWKANQYYLYSEASVELSGYPILNPDARFTQQQVRRIVSYARERHIDVIPCMELYGHLHDLFRVERYAKLAIIPHGSEFDPRNPEVTPLLTNWIGQLADLFPSPFFHIGFDETSETGMVAGRNQVKPAKLFQEQLELVSGLVRLHGKTVLVWSDMFAKYPELIPLIPSGTIVVPWGYDPTVYQPYWKPFADLPVPKFIATGVSIWDQVAPDFARSFSNIDTFLAAGRPHGILGMINTLWTDDVAVLIKPAFPGIAYGAAAAWQAEPVNRASFFSDYAKVTYPGPVSAHVASGLDALGRSETTLAKALGVEWEETMPSFWDDPLNPRHLARAVAHKEDFRQTRLLAEEAEEHLSNALQLGGDASTLSGLLLEARMLDYAGMKNLYAAEMVDFWREMGSHPSPDKMTFYISGEISSHDHSRIADLMDRSGDLRQAYSAAWRESYTPYRLGGVLGKWDAEFQYWWRLKRKLDDYVATFHKGDALRPLESFSAGY
jgi:hypothetical protein